MAAKKDKKIEPNRFGFMVGNKYWQLRSKHGRDRLFTSPELLWEAACDYFQWAEDNPFYENDFIKVGQSAGDIVELKRIRPLTIKNLCKHLNCNSKYFNDFEDSLKDKKDLISRDFSEVITHIKETIEDQKFQGAAVGFFNATIIARDLGLVDKAETKHSVDESVVETFKIGDKVITFGNAKK